MLAGGTTLQTEVSELCTAALTARFGGLEICGVLRGALGDGHVVRADRECPRTQNRRTWLWPAADDGLVNPPGAGLHSSLAGGKYVVGVCIQSV